MEVKFLFIVPTLNSSGNLGNLLNSLRNQTYNNWRILFIDGKSNQEHREWLINSCSNDNRLSWLEQKGNKGIYPAMNYGFKEVKKNEWLLFWGSDDYAININMLEMLKNRILELNKNSKEIDIIFASGNYISDKKKIIRRSKFNFILNYKLSLFLGSCPPHQATLINPNLFKKYKYDDRFKITGDLDFFCRICNEQKLSIVILDLYLVSISRGGISSRKHLWRFSEVIKSYSKIFGKLFFIPFITRYLLKIFRII